MRRCPWMAALALTFALALPLAAAKLSDTEQAVESVAATVLTLEGPAELWDQGRWRALALGQLLGPGDRVRCGPGGGLHLALADGSTLALGPGTELGLIRLGGPAAGSELELRRGSLHAVVERPAAQAGWALRTPKALVRADQPGDLEVQAGPNETVVSVHQGAALLGDPEGRRLEPVLTQRRRRLVHDRLLAEERLAKRDAIALRERWARARVFHAQRAGLINHFKGQERAERARWRKELLERREQRERPKGRKP